MPPHFQTNLYPGFAPGPGLYLLRTDTGGCSVNCTRLLPVLHGCVMTLIHLRLFSVDFRCQSNTLSGDIITMQILFFVAEIGTIKSKYQIFRVIFFNKDFSVGLTTLDITIKFSMRAPHTHSNGSLSQIFFCPSFYFM